MWFSHKHESDPCSLSPMPPYYFCQSLPCYCLAHLGVMNRCQCAELARTRINLIANGKKTLNNTGPHENQFEVPGVSVDLSQNHRPPVSLHRWVSLAPMKTLAHLQLHISALVELGGVVGGGVRGRRGEDGREMDEKHRGEARIKMIQCGSRTC